MNAIASQGTWHHNGKVKSLVRHETHILQVAKLFSAQAELSNESKGRGLANMILNLLAQKALPIAWIELTPSQMQLPSAVVFAALELVEARGFKAGYSWSQQGRFGDLWFTDPRRVEFGIDWFSPTERMPTHARSVKEASERQ